MRTFVYFLEAIDFRPELGRSELVIFHFQKLVSEPSARNEKLRFSIANTLSHHRSKPFHGEPLRNKGQDYRSLETDASLARISAARLTLQERWAYIFLRTIH